MEPEIILLMKNMTSEEKVMFTAEYTDGKKDVFVGVLLAIFLGGLGIHKFWIGDNILGVIYLVFCWTFIPSLIALIDACLMSSSVRKYNNSIARKAYENIRIRRSF
tara:strand:+ start:262 stop:579 length:318 start_codon:yes stop_codon:yes gene_type:complete